MRLEEDDYERRFLELKLLQPPGISIVSVSLIILMMTSHMTLLTLRRVVTTAQLCSLWLHHISSLTALAATAPTTTVTAVWQQQRAVAGGRRCSCCWCGWRWVWDAGGTGSSPHWVSSSWRRFWLFTTLFMQCWAYLGGVSPSVHHRSSHQQHL